MSLLDLPTQTMHSIGRAWLDPAKERPIMARLSLVGPLLGKLYQAQEGLVAFQNAGKQELPEMRELVARTRALDADHDRYARGLYGFLTAIIEASDDPPSTEQYRALRTALFPKGLDINRQSYLVQAGEPPLREGRLSDRDRRLLEATRVTTPEGTFTLRQLLDRLNHTAIALGDAETTKIRLRQQSANESSRGPARRAWARVVSHILATLDLEDELTAEERRRILEPLETALNKAAKARARAKAKGVPFDPDAEEAASEASDSA